LSIIRNPIFFAVYPLRLGHASQTIDRSQVEIKFFVGRRGFGAAVSTATKEEVEQHGDIVVVNAGDEYAVLIAKLRESLAWILAERDVKYIAKFDDDTYVNVANLLAQTAAFPTERLFYGYKMTGIALVRGSGR
jgi:hypothetical protein